VRIQRSARAPLTSFRSPSELPRCRAAERGSRSLASLPFDCLPRGSLPLQRFPASGSGFRDHAFQPVIACAFGFSRPLDAFIRPMPAWPCFMPDPLLGFHPSKLSSSRAAVRRLQRPCPPVVRPPLAPSARSPVPPPLARLRPGRRLRGPPSAPRLQGFAPHGSPPLRVGGLDRGSSA
jgi:hypothetical protein